MRFALAIAAVFLAATAFGVGAGASQRSQAPVRQDFPPLPGSTAGVVITIPTQKPGPVQPKPTTHKKPKPLRCKKGYVRVKVKGKYACRKKKR